MGAGLAGIKSFRCSTCFSKLRQPRTADVQPSPVKLWRMKLKNLIPLRYRTKLIRQFGQAKLVKLPNGQHELVGGTDQDRTTAFE